MRESLHALRNRDEFAETTDEAADAALRHLTLQSLYARPPPVWLHPAFAAEFADAFVAGTGLEVGFLRWGVVYFLTRAALDVFRW